MTPPKPYAAGTTVTAEKSRSEIDTLLTRHGCTHVGIQTAPDAAIVAFEYAGNRYKIRLPMPSAEDVKPSSREAAQIESGRPECAHRSADEEVDRLHRELVGDGLVGRHATGEHEIGEELPLEGADARDAREFELRADGEREGAAFTTASSVRPRSLRASNGRLKERT